MVILLPSLYHPFTILLPSLYYPFTVVRRRHFLDTGRSVFSWWSAATASRFSRDTARQSLVPRYPPAAPLCPYCRPFCTTGASRPVSPSLSPPPDQHADHITFRLERRRGLGAVPESLIAFKMAPSPTGLKEMTCWRWLSRIGKPGAAEANLRHVVPGGPPTGSHAEPTARARPRLFHSSTPICNPRVALPAAVGPTTHSTRHRVGF